MSCVTSRGPFSAHQAAEVLARLPWLRELCLVARDWEAPELSSLSVMLPGVSIIVQTTARGWVALGKDGVASAHCK